MSTPIVLKHLKTIIFVCLQGIHLGKPEDCPAHVYTLMKHCWAWNPADRPEFSTIITRLQDPYGNYDKPMSGSKAPSSDNIDAAEPSTLCCTAFTSYLRLLLLITIATNFITIRYKVPPAVLFIILIIFSATEKDAEPNLVTFPKIFLRKILIPIVVCQLAGCCYGSKVFQHCFFPIFVNVFKIFQGNTNYWSSDGLLLQIKF